MMKQNHHQDWVVLNMKDTKPRLGGEKGGRERNEMKRIMDKV